MRRRDGSAALSASAADSPATSSGHGSSLDQVSAIATASRITCRKFGFGVVVLPGARSLQLNNERAAPLDKIAPLLGDAGEPAEGGRFGHEEADGWGRIGSSW